MAVTQTKGRIGVATLLTPAETGDDLITPDEMAKALRVSGATVRNFIARGEVAATKVGRQWRIPRSELARLRP